MLKKSCGSKRNNIQFNKIYQINYNYVIGGALFQKSMLYIMNLGGSEINQRELPNSR